MEMSKFARSSSLALGILGLGLAGCVGHVERMPVTRVQAPPHSVGYEEPWFVAQDGYVYYPDYEVYYSNTRRNFVYLEGPTWVTRPVPPRVSVDVLFASPSVRFGFRDSPSVYHSQVIRQFPGHWTPPNSASGRGRGDGHGGRGR